MSWCTDKSSSSGAKIVVYFELSSSLLFGCNPLSRSAQTRRIVGSFLGVFVRHFVLEPVAVRLTIDNLSCFSLVVNAYPWFLEPVTVGFLCSWEDCGNTSPSCQIMGPIHQANRRSSASTTNVTTESQHSTSLQSALGIMMEWIIVF